ncbi:cytochrome P450 [Russula ochroleuca]|uniref:Cytochrome P450 n=1 Tax=Russula ochroleuca TaxID=152965 RepID=A0A9P5MNK6_9AGAM|nr:cytochrome P450 [Russula ochroleuca]
MPADEFTLKVSFLMGFLVLLSLFLGRYFRRDPMLDAIPTIGFSNPILSYLSAVQFNFDGVRMLRDGCEKTRPGLFKIANFRRWMVLAAGSELIEDVRKAPDGVLSIVELAIELLQPEYTLDALNMDDSFQTDVIRSKLTQNIAVTFKEVREELFMAMDDFIPMSSDEWVKVPILETLQRVICRTTNRIFVGVPLCRDYDYQTLNLTFAVNFTKFGMIISMVPKPLKLIVSRMLSNLPSQIQQEIEFIRPMVEERFAKMEEYGDDWDDKPVCRTIISVPASLDSWFTERYAHAADERGQGSGEAFAQVLYRLLANPEYIEPLRQEVNAVTAEEGWTKAGIDKMYKIDSFLRETQRADGFNLLPFSRLALRPFTFSNGVTVPAGTLIAIPACATHTDERIYPNPDGFDGFRFSKLRESIKRCPASSEHLAFGLGRHTCPGRFFAVNELKALFAHIVATYDVKFEEGKGVPRELCIAGMRLPGKANVLFRTRQK